MLAMPDTWFTAHFHLGHANIIGYSSRPFATIEEMDQAILERLNALVKPNDTLYFLGDFCMGSQARVLAYRRRIRCKRIFAVPGNHDKPGAQAERRIFLARQSGRSVDSRTADRALSLCPARLEPVQSRIMASLRPLSGRLPEVPNSLSLDVGVDRHDFRPWLFDEIADLMRKRREAQKPSPNA